MLEQARSVDRISTWEASSGDERASRFRSTDKTALVFEQATIKPSFDVVQAYVVKNLHRQVSVPQMAKVAGLSCGYFSRIFKDSTGHSPHAHVIARRLERAMNLMKSPDMKLTEIALECGFSDQAHFCRLFRKSTGWTPAAWRSHFGQSDAGSRRVV